MRLHSASLRNFRNIESAELHFASQFTCLLGPNGQGKTNTIEALYLLAALRPLRNVVRKILLRQGQDEAEVRVTVDHALTGLRHDLGLVLRSGTRVLTKDEKRCDAGQFIGHLVAVAFTPDDLQLAKGGPDGRRRFVDRALLNVRPAYLQAALRYQKAIKDRNRLLAEDAPAATLDAFDTVVAQAGAPIVCARHAYTQALAPKVEARFAEIAQPAPDLHVRYVCQLIDDAEAPTPDSITERFARELRTRRDRDRRRKTTSVGPHLDDLAVTLDGVPARDRASQGQHRALVLALKLAEITHLSEHLKEPPILLLDDMSSELDENRSRQLFEAIMQLDGQVVLTSTEPRSRVVERLGSQSDIAFYSVDSGRLVRSEPPLALPKST